MNNILSNNDFKSILNRDDYFKCDNLQEVYENIGKDLLKKYELNESFTDVIDKIKDKSDDFRKAGKKFMEKMSDSAHKALENIKNEAGKSWDKIKDTITNIISMIDGVIRHSRECIKSLSKLYSLSISNVENYITSGYYYILISDLPFVPNVVEYIANIPKTNTQLFVLNMLLIAIPLVSKTCDMDLQSIQTLIKTIKFAKSNGVAGEISASI